jgi:hypothetical protein
MSTMAKQMEIRQRMDALGASFSDSACGVLKQPYGVAQTGALPIAL